MTLITQSTKAVAQGNGATVTWPFTFLIPAIEDLTVTLVDVASGNPTVIAPVNYTVTGLGNANGGSVTYPLSGASLTAATYIVVERFVPDVQETDLTNQGGVYPQDIEDSLDYLTMITQQLQDQVNRSIVFSVADTVEVTLPPADARAGLFLGFNSNGDPVAVDGLTAGTTVSAAMIPVVTAPTTAAALVALGIPGTLLDALIPAGTVWDYSLPTAPTGFVFPIGQACTTTYPVYRAALIAAGSPYGTNGVDPLMPDLRSMVVAGKSNMGGADNGLLPGGTVLGAVLGSYNRVLVTGNLPPYTPTGNNGSITVTAVNWIANNVNDSTPITVGNGGAAIGVAVSTAVGANVTRAISNGAAPTFTGSAQGGTSTAFSIVQPTLALNKIIKVH